MKSWTRSSAQSQGRRLARPADFPYSVTTCSRRLAILMALATDAKKLPVVDNIRNSFLNPRPDILKVLKQAAGWARAG